MEELKNLKSLLENDENLDFIQKMEIKDKILTLEYQLGVKKKPEFSNIECVGCSA